MKDYNVYVALDVHARSVSARAFVKDSSETKKKHFGRGYCAADIYDWVSKFDGPTYVAYESGCTGITLCRELRKRGVDCDVIAISTLPRSTKDRQQKCDKLDARAILREIINPLSTYTSVWIPTEAQEAAKDLCRLYSQAKDALKSARQELTSFLLRHGYVYSERTKSGNLRKPKGRFYDAWLNSLSFDGELIKQVFEELRVRVDEAERALDRIKTYVMELAESPEYAPYIESLCCLKGIDRLTAMTIVAEFGDFERFSGGRKVSCWVGVVPKNDSSGDSERHGSITKAGNKYLRRALTSALGAMGNWKDPYKQPPKGAEVSSEIRAAARKGNKRIYKKYHHLKEDFGKHPNKARIACVSELARWCWAIGCSVEREQKAQRMSAA